MTRSSLFIAMLLSAAIIPFIAAHAAAQSASRNAWAADPQGTTWDSIKKLPDWRGAWALDEESFSNTRDVSGGPESSPNMPPLTPRYAEIRRNNGAANGGKGPEDTGVITNSANCLPEGMPGIMTAPLAHEYLFTPGQVTVVMEDGEVRRIFTDGRPHPADPDLSFLGHSIGHWEGKTLVVDTVNIKPMANMFVGLHATIRTHVKERIFRRDADTMQIDTTVIDDEVFTRPYSYTRTFKRSPDGMVEYYCTENNRDNNNTINLIPPLD